jgi:hypothetical protein
VDIDHLDRLKLNVFMGSNSLQWTEE